MLDWPQNLGSGQVRANRQIISEFTQITSPACWVISNAAYQISRYLIRSDGKTSYEKVFSKVDKLPFMSVSVFLLMFSLSPQLKNCRFVLHQLHLKNHILCAGKDVITGIHVISLSSGQDLRNHPTCQGRAVQSLRVLMSHQPTIRHDHMLWQDLFRGSFFKPQASSLLSLKREISKVVHSQGAPVSSAQGANSKASSSKGCKQCKTKRKNGATQFTPTRFGC